MRRTNLVLLLALTVGCARQPSSNDAPAARERAFQESLSPATLVGQFTVGNKTGASEDRYRIEGVTRLTQKTWLFRAYIGPKSTIAIPIPVTVEWAGDTPVITVTELTIPGMGTFTARVLFYRGQYAGTWSGGKAGGQMFGKIVKE
jgi:hypothetical protein